MLQRAKSGDNDQLECTNAIENAVHTIDAAAGIPDRINGVVTLGALGCDVGTLNNLLLLILLELSIRNEAVTIVVSDGGVLE